jgi:hypothetical protein
MLTIVPFEKLIDSRVMHLNPNFQYSSDAIGGADTDLIAGDLMVDFKSSKKDEVQVHDLDQLFGYYLLACNQRKIDSAFPPINRVGLYLSRFSHLAIWDTTMSTDHPQFGEMSKWFIATAEAKYARPLKSANAAF